MAGNNFKELVDTLFCGMDGLVTSKTVVGEPLRVDGAVIVPLIEVSCGMGVGAFDQTDAKKGQAGAGGMSSKISPTALLVLQNGNSKLISIKNQDAITKLLEMAPDLIDRLTGGNRISRPAQEKADEMAAQAEDTIEVG